VVRGQRSALSNRLRAAGYGIRVWDAGCRMQDMDMESISKVDTIEKNLSVGCRIWNAGRVQDMGCLYITAEVSRQFSH